MYDPPHPGLIVRQECIKPLHLTITDVARGLGVMRKALSELVNGHAGVSPEMAIRLAKAFSGSPESWLRLQMQHDLWQAQQRADRGEEVRDASAGGVTPRIDDWQRSAPDP